MKRHMCAWESFIIIVVALVVVVGGRGGGGGGGFMRIKNCQSLPILWFQAMKDTARDPDFCVVARVEALIAGWPMEDALERADAFLDAGRLAYHLADPCAGRAYNYTEANRIIIGFCADVLLYVPAYYSYGLKRSKTERFQRTLSIKTKRNMRIFGVIPFIQLQNDT